MKTNIVIAGRYADATVNKNLEIVAQNPRVAEIQNAIRRGELSISERSALLNELFRAKKQPIVIPISNETVLSIESGDKNTRTSGTSAIIRGTVGNLLIGPLGLLAAVGAKKKSTYLVTITWKDETKSVLQLDGEMYTKLLAL